MVNWERRQTKETTRFKVASCASKGKTGILVFPGTTGADIQALLEAEVATKKTNWLVVERNRKILNVFQRTKTFRSLTPARITCHQKEFNLLSEKQEFEITLAWFDLMGNLTWKDAMWLANDAKELFSARLKRGRPRLLTKIKINEAIIRQTQGESLRSIAKSMGIHHNTLIRSVTRSKSSGELENGSHQDDTWSHLNPELELFFTFSNYSRGNRFFGALKKEILRKCKREIKNQISTFQPNICSVDADLFETIIVQYNLLKFCFSEQTFEWRCWTYQESPRASKMILFHLWNFEPSDGYLDPISNVIENIWADFAEQAMPLAVFRGE